jgi:hypothetical protein
MFGAPDEVDDELPELLELPLEPELAEVPEVPASVRAPGLRVERTPPTAAMVMWCSCGSGEFGDRVGCVR